MVRLYLRRLLGARLDDVGVQRPLHQEAGLAQLARFFFERADEFLAYDLALALRLRDTHKLGQEALLRAHVHQRDVEMTAEGVLNLFAFVLPHEPVIDEDARELVTHRLVSEESGYRRIDSAG